MNISTNVSTVARKEDNNNAPPHSIAPSNLIPVSNIGNLAPEIQSQNPNPTVHQTNCNIANDTISIPSPSASPSFTASTSNSKHNDAQHPPQILSLITPTPTPSPPIDERSTNPTLSATSTNPSMRIHHTTDTNRSNHSFQKALSSSPIHKRSSDVTNINLMSSQSSHMNTMVELTSKFGTPRTLAEFNIMVIANALNKSNINHQNRTLKTNVETMSGQITIKQKVIQELNEQVKVYKKQADQYERLYIEFNELKTLNNSLLTQVKTFKTENARYKDRIRQQQHNAALIHTQNTAEKESLEPLQIIEHDENHNQSILAPQHNTIDPNEDAVNGDINEDRREPSQWLKNQRLIQLTGDQTYMTAHQKVIKDPDQKKSHKTYQRQDTIKSLKDEVESLKAQLVQARQELDESQNNQISGSASDGLSAEYWKSLLAKVREELDHEKQITMKFKSTMDSSDDLEQLRLDYAELQAEYDRLSRRYDASKRRTERLHEEKNEADKARDEAIEERNRLKKATNQLMDKTKEHITKLANEKETYVKEAHRLKSQNAKLLKRESEEKELQTEIKKVKKKVSDLERQNTKWKKKYKDLKFETDTGSKKKKKRKKHKKKRKKGGGHDSDASDTKSKETQISEDLESAIEQSKSIDGNQNSNNSTHLQIGNHFQVNEEVQNDGNWSDEEDQMIMSKPIHTEQAMDDMGYGSIPPQMNPIQDNHNIKNEPVQNTHSYQDIQDSEDEFNDFLGIPTENDVFKMDDTVAMNVTKSEDNMASILRCEPMEDDDDDDFDGISDVLYGVSSPCQNPVSAVWNNPFAAAVDPLNINIQESAAAPLVLDEVDMKDENETHTIENEAGDKPQPLFDGGTSDSSDADHSDPVFHSPIQSQPEGFVPMRIEGDDALHIDGNTHLFNDDHDENDGKQDVKTENGLSFDVGFKIEPSQHHDDDEDEKDDAPIMSVNTNQNHKKRPRNVACDTPHKDSTQPATKKRKLNTNTNINHMDDFDSFMEEGDDTTFNTNTNNQPIPAAPPMSTALIASPTIHHTNHTLPIKNENENQTPISANPFPVHSNSKTQTTDTSSNAAHHNTINKPKILKTRVPPTISKAKIVKTRVPPTNGISTQFANWIEEFTHLITQNELQSSDLRTRCIQSIICRWQNPQNACDKQNKPKAIAMCIIEILLLHQIKHLCTNSIDFFASSNSSTYLPLFGALADIIWKLSEKKPKLIFKLKCVIHKIFNGAPGYEKFSSFGVTYYFVCGLAASLCKCEDDAGFFWRGIFRTMNRFEVHQCADLLSIMFECYPAQITFSEGGFVMNCLKHIFTLHSISFFHISEGKQSQRVKQCYQRLMSVVNDKWKHLRCDLDVMIKQQIHKTIKNPNDEDTKHLTLEGISLVCECNIRYVVNELLPNTLYPILYEQLQANKPQLQVFLLDLYYNCVNRVYKRLKQCEEPNCEWIRSDIVMIMEDILILAIGCGGSTDCVDAVVSLCCIRNLLCIQSTEDIVNMIWQNVHSKEKLIQFATNIFQTWSRRITALKGKEKSGEQFQFNAFMNMTENVFKKKCYNMQVFDSLKRQYATKQ